MTISITFEIILLIELSVFISSIPSVNPTTNPTTKLIKNKISVILIASPYLPFKLVLAFSFNSFPLFL